MTAEDNEAQVEQNIDALLDRAIEALNRGDRATATELAEQVLAVDSANADAEDLLAAPTSGGEIRRLTIFFADLVDSTVLSTRTEPETYRTVVGKYREHVLRIVDRYEGHIGSTKGDGLLAVFGHPRAHENDVRRAVQAGLEITRAVAILSQQTQRKFGFAIDVRVGVHRGVVYLDTAQDDVYGLAANYASRVSGLAPPGSVVVSGAIEPLLRRDYELEALPARNVKGIEEPVEHHRVVTERPDRPRVSPGPLIGRTSELDEFRRLWDDVVADTGTSAAGIAFQGEPGLGKSRLATAAADIVEQSGGQVIVLFGSPFHADAGLHPVRTLLERRCGIGRLTPRDERLRLLQAELCAVELDPDEFVPLLAPVLGLTADTGYERASSDGRKLYQRISAAIHDYLAACLNDAPGLILIEDLQWFDASTSELVESLLTKPRSRTLMLITSRDGDHLPSGVTPIRLGH